MAKEDTVTIDYTGNSKNNKRRISKDEEELQELLRSREPKETPEDEDEKDVQPATEGTEESEEEKTEHTKDDAGVVPDDESEDEDDNLSAEDKQFKKRYGDLRRYTQKLKDEIKALKEKPVTADDLPVSEEDLEAWRQEHPGVYARIEAIAQGIAEKKIAAQEDRFKKLEELEESTRREKAMVEIEKKHSDFRKLKASDDFHDWAGKQPKWIQDALYDNEDDATAVVRVIDLYKADKGLTPSQRKEKQKEALEDVKGGRTSPDSKAGKDTKTYTESDIRRMSDKEFLEKLEDIEKAKREGRFIYDLSQKKT